MHVIGGVVVWLIVENAAVVLLNPQCRRFHLSIGDMGNLYIRERFHLHGFHDVFGQLLDAGLVLRIVLDLAVH